jgi:hypothetical protein
MKSSFQPIFGEVSALGTIALTVGLFLASCLVVLLSGSSANEEPSSI